MDLLPTDEQDEIVATIRAQLDRHFSLNDLAASDGADTVVAEADWQRCAELGWFALGVAEERGGVGYSLVEEVLLFEQLGEHATPGPFLATVLAAHLLAGAGRDDLLGAVLGGERRVALAEVEHGGDSAARILDHGGADLALLITEDGVRLVSLDGVAVEAEVSLDPLVPLGVADISGAEVLAVATGDEAAALWRRATVLSAAEMAGIARATAEQSTDYVKDREQFGRPVGSFQAVKHRCADMAVRADAALNIVRLAALSVRDDAADAVFQAEAARVVAADAAVLNARINVQNHGGIGFTWEHTAHRYVTRAELRSRCLGGRAGHVRALLAQDAP